MHDLRRRALESSKTVSKKAKSRQGSRANSRATSPARLSPAVSPIPSRAGSRAGSDEEDGLSDETSLSAASFDAQLRLEDAHRAPAGWEENLRDLMNDIIERSWKKSHKQTRIADLNHYVRTLTSYYAYDIVAERESELIDEFLKTMKAGSSEEEKLLAMQALAMTIITIPSVTMGETIVSALKQTASATASSPTIKSAAIHTLGLIWFYEHLSDTETLEKMKYFIKIASSDGEVIDALDEPDPVAAALEEWGFLASQIDDFTDGAGEEYITDDVKDPMEVFIDQLDSTFPAIQIAAGENIALLYEKADLDADAEEDFSGEDIPDVPWVTQARYDEGDLKHKLLSLSTIHSRSLSAKTKKILHSSFDDILHSVENPSLGPQYQKALNSETGNPYGSRKALRVHDRGAIRINSWEKLHTLQGLQRVLQGGFLLHYQENEEVYGKLPTLDTRDAKVIVLAEMVGGGNADGEGEDGDGAGNAELQEVEKRVKHKTKRNKMKRMGWGGDED